MTENKEHYPLHCTFVTTSLCSRSWSEYMVSCLTLVLLLFFKQTKQGQVFMGKVFILRNPYCLLIYRVWGLIPAGYPASILNFGLSTLDYSPQKHRLYCIFICQIQLHWGEFRVSIENPCVNKNELLSAPCSISFKAFGEACYIGEINLKSTQRSPSLPLVLILCAVKSESP